MSGRGRITERSTGIGQPVRQSSQGCAFERHNPVMPLDDVDEYGRVVAPLLRADGLVEHIDLAKPSVLRQPPCREANRLAVELVLERVGPQRHGPDSDGLGPEPAACHVFYWPRPVLQTSRRLEALPGPYGEVSMARGGCRDCYPCSAQSDYQQAGAVPD